MIGLQSDKSLADQGRNQLEWAETHMPVLVSIRRKYSDSKPLTGKKIGLVLHVTKETGVLARTLNVLGAELRLAASNPLSTQDDIAAALAEEGIQVRAKRGESNEEYFAAIRWVAESSPDIVVDDGGDLHTMLHKEYKSVNVIGGTEETTTGVNRLRAMERDGILRYPVIAVNDAYTKHLFDNRFGTGQSTVDGLMRATNILIAGKTCVVAGYGWVGRGIASRLRGMGGKVVVTETSPIRALEAVMDGFEVMQMSDASKIGDIFITATGNREVITYEHIMSMKDGAVLANSGHFDVEIDMKTLVERSVRIRQVRQNLDEHRLSNGRRVYVIAKGRLANLGAAEGHPSEVMDMSFSDQALSIIYLARTRLPSKLYPVPQEIDSEVATLKLESMGVKIDRLTESQISYQSKWE
ncbi:MAG: adenosylhomocysteinase [Conexivisphaerales archaeon]